MHTGMDVGPVFLKVVPFSTRKTSSASFAAFEKKIIPSPPPPHISDCTMGPKHCFCPRNNMSGTPLPYFEGGGCEKRDCRDTQIVTHTIYSICMHQNLPFFFQSQPKIAVSWSNINFLGSDKQLKTPLPILRVLDAKEQIVATQRSHKHNLQHPYAPKCAIFLKRWQKMAVFLVTNGIFGRHKILCVCALPFIAPIPPIPSIAAPH